MIPTNTSASFKLLAACLVLIGSAACKSIENSTKTTKTEKESELEELYWARVDSSRMNFTDADVKFMTGMIAHHAQALVMSRLAPKNDAKPAVQRLSARIINAQKDEIATMQRWLRNRNQPVPKINIDGLNLMITLNGQPYTSYKNMPGVLSQEKLEDLAKARGSDFDRLYLKYMIEHHSGAVHMVKKLVNTDGAAQDTEAFTLASGIRVDQATEIKRMSQMLDRLSQSR